MLQENAVNGQVLESLTEQDMLTMGLCKFGWRRQLLLCRQELVQQLELQGAASQEAEMMEIYSSSPTSASSSRSMFGDALLKSQQLDKSLGDSYRRGASPSRSDEPKAIDTRRSTHCSSLVPCQRLTASDGPGAYFVDNSLLRSEQEGLHFYRTMDMSEAACKAWVPWGAVIQGIPVGNDWIKVGEYYLPLRLNGVVVLKREATSRRIGASATVMRPRVQSPCGRPGAVHMAPHVPVRHCLRPAILQYPSLVPAPPRAVPALSPHGIAYRIPNPTWAPPPHTVPYTLAKLGQTPTTSAEPSSCTWMLYSTVGGPTPCSGSSCEVGCGPAA